MASCLVISGLTLLVLAFLLSAVSFCAPYWIVEGQLTIPKISGNSDTTTKIEPEPNVSDDPSYKASKNKMVGLLAECTDDGCKWIFQNDFDMIKNHQSTFMHAIQGLFALGLVTCIVAMIVAISNISCKACSDSACVLITIGILMTLVFMEIAASVGLYGYHKKDDGLKDNQLKFHWGFFAGMGGAVFAFLSAILYFIESRRIDPHAYERTHAI